MGRGLNELVKLARRTRAHHKAPWRYAMCEEFEGTTAVPSNSTVEGTNPARFEGTSGVPQTGKKDRYSSR